MKALLHWSSAIFVVLLFFSTAWANDDSIQIGAGDTIAVTVYNEPDLTVKSRVSESGLVRIPLLGDVNVAGKTPQQLASVLEAMYLDGYLVAPSVSVQITAFRPFYVRGEVKRAGAFVYEPGLTVNKAIAKAGGLSERASKESWWIIREPDTQRMKVTGEMAIVPGDILEIEESFF